MSFRLPKPFWRASKNSWYIQLPDGRQRSLGPDEGESDRLWHELRLH